MELCAIWFFSILRLNLPSSLHLMLSVTELQEILIPIIIEKMIKYHVSQGIDNTTSHSIIHHVITQFRWLNELADGTSLINSLIDTIKSLDDSVIADIIILFPDIFDYRHHDRLAQELKSLLSSNTSIFATIYHVLGCISLSVFLQYEIHCEAIELLINVPLNQAHLMIKANRLSEYYESVTNNWIAIEYGIRYIRCVPDLNVDFMLCIIMFKIHDADKILKIVFALGNSEFFAQTFHLGKKFVGIFTRHLDSYLEMSEALIHHKNASIQLIFKNVTLSICAFLDKTAQDKIFHRAISYAHDKNSSVSQAAISLLNDLVRQQGFEAISYASDLMNLISSRNRKEESETLFQIIMYLNLLSPASSETWSSLADVECLIFNLMQCNDLK
ncbi:hypothetical protein MXB_1241 [Myxobolus squamalis]|nr:hypothetical protein MXB_1241 [Myxobolus squamalis]